MYARLFRQPLAAGAGSSGDFLPPSAPGGKAPLAKRRRALRHRDRARNNLCIELLNRQRQHSLTVNEQFLDEGLSVADQIAGGGVNRASCTSRVSRGGPRAQRAADGG